MTTPLELLAPAPDAEIGIAAINHGADAVYIGAPKFSARAQAGASTSEISRLIQHAHFFRAKVYVALNTILTDAELSEAHAIIREVYDLGADALIIQDVGLLELDLPPIALIASTQMHNATPEKVRFLEEAGFQRAILARELSIQEIADIRQSAKRIELEAFVHGALCVCYSGQCYMSQAIAGRSANRGICAQPCRSHYSLTDGDGKILAKNKYLLSLKDLCRIDAIGDLVSAGVTSFKIEGRYKGIDYVKNVTAAYRQAIDNFISSHQGYSRSSAGTSAPGFVPDVFRTFNRGYTQYFLSGHPDHVASIHTQKSLGQGLGSVISVGKDFFELEGPEVQNGDGLCFFTRQHKLIGCRVNRVQQGKIYPGSMEGLEAGVNVFRNADTAFVKALKRSEGNRRIAVEMVFRQDSSSVHLLVTDEDGNSAETQKDVACEPARNPRQALTQIEEHLGRTGNTPYHLTKLTIEPSEPGFWTAGFLNGIRREALEALTHARRNAYRRAEFPLMLTSVPYPERILDYRANVLNGPAKQFYERHGATVSEPAFETLGEVAGKTVMTTRYCIRHELGGCLLASGAASIKEPLRLHDAHHTYRLDFDCKACKMRVILEK